MGMKKLTDILRDVKVNLTEEDILEKLYDRLRWPRQYHWGQPSVSTITEEDTKNRDFFLEDNYINSKKYIEYYEGGHTLILSNIGYTNKDTTKIQIILNKHFKKHINCNFYFGKGNKSVSFKKHNHPYNVIVKNIYGESSWIINGEKIKLNKQNTLFIKKNTNHEVMAIKNKKLSMTLNLN